MLGSVSRIFFRLALFWPEFKCKCKFKMPFTLVWWLHAFRLAAVRTAQCKYLMIGVDFFLKCLGKPIQFQLDSVCFCPPLYFLGYCFVVFFLLPKLSSIQIEQTQNHVQRIRLVVCSVFSSLSFFEPFFFLVPVFKIENSIVF